MLVLARKRGEEIRIGSAITLVVLEVVGNRVKLGIQAPGDVPILRSEMKRKSYDITDAVVAQTKVFFSDEAEHAFVSGN